MWIRRYNGPSNNADWGYAISVNNSNNIFVSGTSYGSGTAYDFVTIKYVQSGAIAEIENSNLTAENLIVYPNPAKTFLNVRSSFLAFPSSLKLFDITGKEVKSVEVRGKNCRVSLDGFKNGVYFVSVNDEMVKEKLVVTK